MPIRKYCAEFLGTFFLTFMVLLSLLIELPVSTPILAGLTLGLFVYTLGPVSGAYFNPAVTVGMVSVGKTKVGEGFMYLVVQVLGAYLAMLFAEWFTGSGTSLVADNAWRVGLAEALGTLVLTLGVSAVIYKKAHPAAAGLVIGGSLVLGTYLASGFSNAILNPAVAIGLNSISWMYLVAPLAGALVAAWLFRLIQK